MRYKLTLCRPFLRELRLAVTPPSMYANQETNVWLERLSRFVAASLHAAPRLELLDLHNYCGASEQIALVIRAAATFCSQLQSLILPPDGTEPTPGRTAPTFPDVSVMHDAVLYGLQK